MLLFHQQKSNDNKSISKHVRFCWQQLFGPLRNIAISLKSIRPNKTEIKFIAEKVFDKCLHPGPNLQLALPYDHCSNALLTELPPLLRNYLWNFVKSSQTDKVLWEFYWNFPFLIFNDKVPVKRSQLFIQQRTTFVVKKKFVPFDHLVVCCCIVLYVVVWCFMKFARDQKCLWNKCCAIEHLFCFQWCCMLLLLFDHLPKLCCVRGCAAGLWFPAIIDLTLYLPSTCTCQVSRVQVLKPRNKIWE